VDYNALAKTIGIIAAYAGVGIALLAVGFVVMDLIIPGDLRKQIWEDKNTNCTAITASALGGLGIMVAASIRAANGDLAEGLQQTVAFSLLGVVLLALSFWILDLLTPGNLGETIAEDTFHPATVISVVTNVVIAIVVSAAIL
jgi:uncharacterized membrane protein YjfL (UPF0719 family)